MASTKVNTVVSRVVTAVLVIAPGVALGVAIPLLWGQAISLVDILIAVVFYLATGFGVTVGFHRMFTHRSFTPKRPLKIALATAGSMAFEGSIISWVANHRRHHMFSDQEGDPHSPHRYGSGGFGAVKGFAHAHIGWLFNTDTTSSERYAPDLLRDTDVVRVNRMFPLLAILSLAAPFALGWLITGNLLGAFTALLWAGVVRIAVLHHVTWSINSICHMFGPRPFETTDRSTNFGPLALLSLGESWHSYHHASPSSARHGVLPHQIDASAGLIKAFERMGWATDVRWPTTARIAAASR